MSRRSAAPRSLGGIQVSTADNAADDTKKMIDRLVFPHPCCCSSAYRGYDPLGLGRRAEHDHARLAVVLRHVRAEGDGRVIRQVGIEQDDIE